MEFEKCISIVLTTESKTKKYSNIFADEKKVCFIYLLSYVKFVFRFISLITSVKNKAS